MFCVLGARNLVYASVVLGPGMTDMGTGDTNTRALQESSTREDFRRRDGSCQLLPSLVLINYTAAYLCKVGGASL